MGGSAPKPDPRMGEAALLSASTGRDMLAWMRNQAKVTNNWASTDRARYVNLFQPVENKMVREAMSYDTPQRKQMEATKAVADVRQQAAIADGTVSRQMMSMGVGPNSRRFAGDKRRSALSTAVASAGARNLARRQVDATGDAMRANVVNLGRGMAVNPATSMGLSNNAMSSGFQGAMSGYGQQSDILGAQYDQQMQQWNAKQGALDAIGGAIGTVAGVLPWGAMLSSEKVKEDFKEVDALGAVRKMPVKGWKYKDGVADGGRHVGPIAEDFAKATGVGDGTTIDPITAVGVTMGAVRQLDKKVEDLTKVLSGMGARPKSERRAAA